MKQSKRVVLERQQRIFELVYEKERVSVEDICDRFGISDITARRDITALSDKELVLRYHGGAMTIPRKDFDYNYREKESRAIEKKQSIARKLSDMLPEGSVLFCSGGSTITEFFRCVKHCRFTIVSSNARLFTEAEDSDCRLICVGGEYNNQTEVFCSRLTPSLIARYHIEYCILGADGFSAEYGGTSTTAKMLETSEITSNYHRAMKTVVIADGTKIGLNWCFPLFGIENVDWLVTDETADKKELEKIRQKGVKVFVAQ